MDGLGLRLIINTIIIHSIQKWLQSGYKTLTDKRARHTIYNILKHHRFDIFVHFSWQVNTIDLIFSYISDLLGATSVKYKIKGS